MENLLIILEGYKEKGQSQFSSCLWNAIEFPKSTSAFLKILKLTLVNDKKVSWNAKS